MREKPHDLAFMDGGGELGALMRARDWSTSGLGDPSFWPQSLRVAVRLLLNTGHPMYVWWGAEGFCLYNDAYRRSIGHERHPDSLGRPARQVWEEIWPIIGPQIAHVMSGGGSIWEQDALVPITRNGIREEVYWTYSYSPISDSTAASGIGGVLVICSETTGQVLAKRVAEQQRDQLTRLFEQAPSFMAVLRGPRHHFEYANPAYLRLVGDRPIVGMTVAEALPEAVEQGYLALLDDVFRTGRSFVATGAKFTAQPTAATRDERFVDFVYQPMADRDEVVTGIFIEGVDVTDRVRGEMVLREREKELSDLNASLEDRIAQRTAELEQTYEALHQSQKMEAVGQLTGGLAHDFNNLLTSVSGSLEMLQRRMSQGRAVHELERYLGAAQGAARRAAALTQRLLAFSRRQALEPRPTDVNALISGMEELLRQSVGTNVGLSIVQGKQQEVALVDANQLESALLNLCINARDAMPGGGLITIETTSAWVSRADSGYEELPAGRFTSISVTDSGTGMSQAMMDRVFEPFFTTKPIGAGTGLGLSMVHGFVKQSGGRIRITSRPGHGTTVSLHLPSYEGPVLEDESRDRTTVPEGHARSVLVVDDELPIRMLAADILTDLGFVSTEACDGISALAMLQSDRRFDLLITDVGLPGGVNGRQLAEAGRTRHPDLRVIFITGYAEAVVMGNRPLEFGMTVLAKPFSPDALAERIAFVTQVDIRQVEPQLD